MRTKPRDPLPLSAGERVVLVTERGGERRLAAERWWRHETGGDAEIREGVAWALRFEAGARAEDSARDLATLRGRDHGLLCNPHWQEARLAAGTVPLPWITGADAAEDLGPAGTRARGGPGAAAAARAGTGRRASKGAPPGGARARRTAAPGAEKAKRAAGTRPRGPRTSRKRSNA